MADVVVTDVRMPPTFTDEGIRSAVALRIEDLLAAFAEDGASDGAFDLDIDISGSADDLALVVNGQERLSGVLRFSCLTGR